jgi:hypothetical protein
MLATALCTPGALQHASSLMAASCRGAAFLPLSSTVGAVHHRGMTVSRTRPDPEVDQLSVLVDGGPGEGLVVLPRRIRDDLLARLHADSLDSRLAAGEPPESSRLLAVRAAQLTSPSARHRLARYWDDAVSRSRRAQLPHDPHAPVSRSQIDAAAQEIRLVAGILRAHRPVSAQGVALATALLTTPTSPVYRRTDDPCRLATALSRAAGRF